MIESIEPKIFGNFGEMDPTDLKNLNPINYVFGTNGTGMPLLSKLIYAENLHESERLLPKKDCNIKWENDIKQKKTLVYNRDIVQIMSETLTSGKNEHEASFVKVPQNKPPAGTGQETFMRLSYDD